MSVGVRPEAEADIDAIVAHIAIDSPAAAARWIEDMYRRFRRLGDMPGIGVARPDIRPELRLLPAGHYLILYEEIAGDVAIVRVLHGARQWQDLLS